MDFATVRAHAFDDFQCLSCCFMQIQKKNVLRTHFRLFRKSKYGMKHTRLCEYTI